MSISDKFFISSELHEKEVPLADGSKHVLHFKELEASEFEKFHEARASDVASERYGAMPNLIALSVCEPDGKPAMTVKQAMTLKPKIQSLLSGIILEINGFKEKKDSPSADANGSDTNSA
jgi:hypothetical protein